ncbi:hypothetical protein PN36_15130 [Candidatus Thiomargarita nelsonii]|uniref:Uncharacterized protein n=1 Tax=Candidatus Thiomargarita nelsonii TaxID=1003181 RepID=A0A0A6P3P1_9GAMM|nr:hypothetical protein PN36_15130 [Candidatus Thiomargarita nelsonii]
MSNSEKCSCGSDDIYSHPKRKVKICLDCKLEWAMDAPPPTPAINVSLSKANDPQVKAFCRNLAHSTPWIEKVTTHWPAPIAHEYHRLREVLGDEQLIVSAVWQLKDVAEVLLKFPAIVMAQWVFTEQRDMPLFKTVQQDLLSQLSMGDWLDLAGNTLAKPLCQSPIANVGSLFRSSPKKVTGLYDLLKKLIKWRNDKLGHGALGLEIDEDFKKDLADYVNQLNQQLAHYQDIWDGMLLQDANGQNLQGWQTIRQRHELQVPGAHVEQNVALQLNLGEKTLLLSPWLTLKRCTVCQKQDVFFFDSRRQTGKKKDRYEIYFLDYLAAHKMSRPGHLEPQLALPIAPKTSSEISEGYLGGDYGAASLDNLLQEKSLEAEYLSPTYLREPLKAFIESHEQGVYWLRAPAHIGKSIFCAGFADGAPTARLTSHCH